MTKTRTCPSIRALLLAAGAAMAAASAAMAQPANDLCTAAQVVTNNSSNPADNTNATSDVPFSSCAFTPTDNLDVWFSFTADVAGAYTFDTEGSVILDDTTISLYSSCGGVELACDDDSGTGLLSSLTYNLAANETVLIRVAGWDGGFGPFFFNVSGGNPPPANDDCALAETLTNSGFSGTSVGAGGTDISSCSFEDSNDVWFAYTASGDGTYIFDTNGSILDTTLSAFDFCGGTELGCNDDIDYPINVNSSLTLSLTNGQTVLLRVAGYDGAVGAFQLNAQGPFAAPDNDLCVNATVVTPGSSTLATNVGASSDIAASSCGFTPTDDLDVWFSLTITTPGTYTIDTNGSTDLTDTTLSIYDACGGFEIACDDDAGDGLLSLINFEAGAQTYYIRVAGWDHQSGQFFLNVSNLIGVPSNDTCATATPITPNSSTPGNNTAATSEIPFSSCAFTPTDDLDVWYALTITTPGNYRIDTNGSTGLTDTTLSVYDACGGVEILCDDDSGDGLLSSLVLNANAGTYYIRIAGWDSQSGNFMLNVSDVLISPSNDECVNATPITTGSTTFGSNNGAVGTDITSCSFNDVADVWYLLTVGTAGNITIDTEGTAGLDTAISVWSACGGVEIACDDDGGTDLLSSLNFSASVGSYLVRVAAYNGGEGNFQLNVSSPVAGPANDACENAIAVSPNSSTPGDSTGAAGTDISSCSFADAADVWYSLTVVDAGLYTVDTNGSSFDTTVSAFDACGGTQLACNDDIAFPDNTNSLITLNLGANQTVLIRVAGYDGGTGAFVLNVGAPQPPLGNDTCGTATSISGNYIATADNSTASNEVDEPGGSCNSVPDQGIDNSIWYTFVPGSNGTLSGIINPANYDGVAVLFTGSCGLANLIEVACWDEPEPWDLANPDSGSSAVSAGVTYFLAIGDWGTGDGGGLTEIDITIPGGAGGACCSGTTCSVVAGAGACSGINTAYSGDGTVCNVPGNNTTPCCKADFNQNGSVTVQDIFDFLNAYFSASAQADINGGGTSVQDIFDFLAAYFGGCP